MTFLLGTKVEHRGPEDQAMQKWNRLIGGTGPIPGIFLAFFEGLNFREYPQEIWPYMVLTYLHLLDPEIPIDGMPYITGLAIWLLTIFFGLATKQTCCSAT